MQKKFFIIIGKSGSGKGTQAPLLRQYLLDNGLESVKHITTGGSIREFLKTNNSYTSDIMRKVVNSGGILNDFLAIWNWANVFINNINEYDSIILDGAPRKLSEAKVIDDAIKTYSYDNTAVIYIDVSDKWALEKLGIRGRSDDKEIDNVNKKMEWFASDVLPVIDWYKNINTKVNFYHINGEQTPEDVHTDIIKSLEMYE